MKKYMVATFLILTACMPGATSAPTNTSQPFAALSPATRPTQIEEINTRTPAPTEYSTAVAERKVREYLLTNNGCNLPCFWGISPGETSLDDAVKFFQPFGITNRNAVGLYILSKNILNGASLFEEDKKIIGIEVFGEGRPDEVSSFWQIWSSYLPHKIIEQYGFPDRVWFDTYDNPEVPNPEKPVGYSLWFFYDEKGFLLVYSGITTKSPEYQVCLGEKAIEGGFSNLSANIQLLIHQDISLENFAVELGVDQRKSFYSETNPEIPMDEFKKNFIDQAGCFNAPANSSP